MLTWPWLFPSVPVPDEQTKLRTPKFDQVPAPPATESVSWFEVANKKYHSAVLIAGSHGYYNYRHQADVCHAYRILRERGLEDDKIITFVYDDIAHHAWNPYPGQIFNAPGGRNVYPGCAKDYTGTAVNKRNVLAVLTGNADAVRGMGSGRVLNPDPDQRVFFFYSDHGSVGAIGMPTGGPLYGRELKRVIDYMEEKKFFKELVFYLESCESGSMFKGLGYEDRTNILMVSASGDRENSYATYCPNYYDNQHIVPNASYIKACLGDLFSVSWMEFAEKHDIASKNIHKQLEYVTKRTSDDFTYKLGSHVYEYGDINKTMTHEVVGNFLSYFNVPSGKTWSDVEAKKTMDEAPMAEKQVEVEEDGDDDFAANGMKKTFSRNGAETMKQRDADLKFLIDRVMENDGGNKQEAMLELEKVLEERRFADQAIRSIVLLLMQNGILSRSNTVEEYVDDQLHRTEEQAVVDDWDCLMIFAEIWEESCGELTDYSQQYTRAFANLCNLQVPRNNYAEAVGQVCGRKEFVVVT